MPTKISRQTCYNNNPLVVRIYTSEEKYSTMRNLMIYRNWMQKWSIKEPKKFFMNEK